MKISIAMASYNGAEYIEAQLQSFVDQSLQPDEVIITDDRSTDNTVELVQEFAKTCPFKISIFVNEKNLGYAGNFNAALEKTSGNLVFLSDQDDVWFPKKIEHMANCSEQNPNYQIYMNDALLTDGELNSVDLTKYGQIKSAGLTDAEFVMGCCCAIRREFLEFVLPIPSKLKAHDEWLVKICDALNAKLIDSEVLQYYRRHGNNESQYVVNSLTPVTKWDHFLHSVKSIFKSNSHDEIIREIQQFEVFIEGLKTVSAKVPVKFQKDFQQLIHKKENKLKLSQARLVIRKSNFFVRLSKVIKLFFNGYSKNTRFKNMLRDLVGK